MARLVPDLGNLAVRVARQIGIGRFDERRQFRALEQLVEIARRIEDRFDAVEARLAALEEDSHAPVDLRRAIREEVARALAEEIDLG